MGLKGGEIMPLAELYHALKAEFLREIGAVVVELETYNDDELFYRRWYELRNDKKSLLEYIASFDIEELRRRNLILPEDIEESKKDKSGIVLLESRFFPPGQDRSVFLYKHNRYSPAFDHSHNYFEIFFVLQGQCVNTIADKSMILGEGTLCFIAPEVHHTIEVFDDSIIIDLMIKRSTFDEVFLNLLTRSDILSGFFMHNIYHQKSPEYIIFNIAHDIELLEEFLAMLIEQRRGGKLSASIMDNRLSIFFSLLVRKHGNSPLIYDQMRFEERHWKIIAYINEYFRTITLSKLAARFNLSAAYCSRIIKSITGKNFTALIRDLRMNQARSMLASSNTKIYEISYSLGYENQETFIRDFKKIHGVTPSRYRKTLKINCQSSA
jgi:AraC-like DNA-binding protein/mannose-6-phosphate isomerase-like protein (cupin superfamily)